jgi:transposase, IS6 family
VKVAGRWRYVYRAIDQFGQVVDVFVSARWDARAARGSSSGHRRDQAHAGRGRHRQGRGYLAMLEELLPGAWHRTDRYANNHIEADHGRLKARFRPMRGLSKTAVPGS